MKSVVHIGALVAAGLLNCSPASAQSLEPFKLFDDFKTATIDPNRWIAPEFVRVIKNGSLNMMQRNWPSMASDTGSTAISQSDALTNPGRITALKAKISVNAIEVSSCTSNTDVVSESRARILASFFNASAQLPNSQLNDVIAQVRVLRRSNSTDAAGVLRIEAVLQRCDSADCNSALTIDQPVQLGTVKVGKPVTLQMQWDKANKAVLFLRDNGSAGGTVSYGSFTNSVTGLPYDDTLSPSVSTKNVSTRTIQPNCQSGTRTSAMIDAAFDDVQVNNSY